MLLCNSRISQIINIEFELSSKKAAVRGIIDPIPIT